MLTESPEARSRIFLLILDRGERSIFCERSGDAWSLPSIDLAGEDFELAQIAPEVERKYGLDIRTLRLLHEDDGQHFREVLFEVDNLSADQALPPSGRWAGADALPDLISAEACAAIGARLRNRERAKLRSWMKRGWHTAAEAWVKANAEALGYSLNGPIEELRSWEISCVLRASTDQGILYFKSSGGSPLFVNEAVVTRGLSVLFPRCVPRPLAVEPNRNWMLLADLGTPVGLQLTVQKREAIFRAFGELQRSSAGKCQELLELGCIDRRMRFLSEQIDALARDRQAVAGLPAADQDRFLALVPEFKSSCERLAAGRMPNTLVHGDLSMNNLAEPNGNGDFVFFDWTDASVSHPFMDLIAFHRVRDPETLARMRDAYLSAWTEYADGDDLSRIWDMALPLCALNQAISYRAIASQCEPSAAQGNHESVGFWIGRAMESYVPA